MDEISSVSFGFECPEIRICARFGEYAEYGSYPVGKLYGKEDSETSPSLRFQGVIRRASETMGCKVAILVDEYDKPLLQTIGNEVLQAEYRNTLKAFMES